MKRKNSQALILAYLSRHTCATLDNLVNDLGLSQSAALSACSRLRAKGLITYKWLKMSGGKRKRLYCISSTFLKEIHA